MLLRSGCGLEVRHKTSGFLGGKWGLVGVPLSGLCLPTGPLRWDRFVLLARDSLTLRSVSHILQSGYHASESGTLGEVLCARFGRRSWRRLRDAGRGRACPRAGVRCKSFQVARKVFHSYWRFPLWYSLFPLAEHRTESNFRFREGRLASLRGWQSICFSFLLLSQKSGE